MAKETFREGVHNYLAAHMYANATAEDFWNAQTANSHKPVDKIMESLVEQPGVPGLTFAEPAGGKVEVRQQRFFLSPSSKGRGHGDVVDSGLLQGRGWKQQLRSALGDETEP